MASWITASSVPSAFAPSVRRSIVAGRRPSAYICWRVSTRRTERCSGARRQHRQHHFILRAQARAEGAAGKRRHDADIVGLHVEDAADVALHVLHALRLVVDGDPAVAVPHDGRGEQLHRIVVLDRDEILGLMAHVGCRVGFIARRRAASRAFRPRRHRRARACRSVANASLSYSTRTSVAANARSPIPRPAPARSADR